MKQDGYNVINEALFKRNPEVKAAHDKFQKNLKKVDTIYRAKKAILKKQLKDLEKWSINQTMKYSAQWDKERAAAKVKK